MAKTFNNLMAHRSGYLARQAGRGLGANPYGESDLRRLEWRRGWLAADLDADEAHAHAKITDEMR